MKKAIGTIILIMLIMSNTAFAVSGHDVVEEYLSHGEFDTPVYLQEILDLWDENGIIVDLPKKEPGSRNNDERSWDRYLITDQFEIIYTLRMDGQWDVMSLYFPKSWKPYRDAARIAIAYVAEVGDDEAEEIFEKLEYNQLARSSKSTVTDASVDVTEQLSLYLADYSDRVLLQIWRYFE